MSCLFQAIFDRNRKDELPGLQLEWIDGICAPLYEVTLTPTGSVLLAEHRALDKREKSRGLRLLTANVRATLRQHTKLRRVQTEGRDVGSRDSRFKVLNCRYAKKNYLLETLADLKPQLSRKLY